MTKKDLLNSYWYSNNVDSIFYTSDTVELIQYVFEERNEFYRESIRKRPSLLLNRRWVRRAKIDHNDEELFFDLFNLIFEKKGFVTAVNKYQSGNSEKLNDHSWRWNFDPESQIINIVDTSSKSRETVMSFEIIEMFEREVRSYNGDLESAIILKIMKR